MKVYAIAILTILSLSGCTTHSSKSVHDLTAVCLTDQDKPVSKGTTYKGRTCSEPDTVHVYPKPNLVWR